MLTDKLRNLQLALLISHFVSAVGAILSNDSEHRTARRALQGGDFRFIFAVDQIQVGIRHFMGVIFVANVDNAVVTLVFRGTDRVFDSVVTRRSRLFQSV